jgi:hypothetical protein
MLLRLLVAMAIALSTLSNAGCTEQSSPSPLTPGPRPTSSSFNLSGSVLETTASGSRPVGDIPHYVRVRTVNSWGHFGDTGTDAQGRYSISNLPRGTVYLEATWTAYLQPCFASMDLQRDAALDVEVISPATLLSLGLSSVRNVSGRTVSGLVFETTTGGVRPVSGANIQVWVGDWMFGAKASSDASGRYLICRVPRDLPINLYTDKDGYRQHIAEVLPGGDTTFDIHMERQGTP